MTSGKSRKPRRWLVGVSALNGAFLLLLWGSNRFVSEASWLTMMFAYLPQILFAVPTIVIAGIWAVKRKWWAAGGNAAIFLGFFFVTAGLQISFPRPRPANRLKVLTLNIQRGKQGLQRVLDLIKREKPDVFCLQECDSTKEEPLIDTIRAAMIGYQIEESQGVAVGSRLPVKSFRVVPLPYGKPLVEARVTWDGSTITVADVHLVAIFIDRYLLEAPGKIPDHLRRAGFERDEQLSALLVYASQAQNLVLCGDFNAPANAGFHRKLRERLRDSFEESGTGFGYTIPASFPLMRLDFVYTGGAMVANRCDVLGDVVSDHRAVVAELATR